MSATVTYKGNTLTTAENQTRTLKTAGKYMEDDVVITDVTSGGVGWTDITSSCTFDDDTVYINLDINGYIVAASFGIYNITFDEDYNAITCFCRVPGKPFIIGEVFDTPSSYQLSINGQSSYSQSQSLIMLYDWLEMIETRFNGINWIKMIPMPT